MDYEDFSNPEEYLDYKQKYQLIRKCIDSLQSDYDKDLIRQYFGIDEEALTIRQMVLRHGVSGIAIANRLSQALDELVVNIETREFISQSLVTFYRRNAFKTLDLTS